MKIYILVEKEQRKLFSVLKKNIEVFLEGDEDTAVIKLKEYTEKNTIKGIYYSLETFEAKKSVGNNTLDALRALGMKDDEIAEVKIWIQNDLLFAVKSVRNYVGDLKSAALIVKKIALEEYGIEVLKNIN